MWLGSRGRDRQKEAREDIFRENCTVIMTSTINCAIKLLSLNKKDGSLI